MSFSFIGFDKAEQRVLGFCCCLWLPKYGMWKYGILAQTLRGFSDQEVLLEDSLYDNQFSLRTRFPSSLSTVNPGTAFEKQIKFISNNGQIITARVYFS